MTDDSDERIVLLNELGEEFAERHRRGEHPKLQEYIDRHPELADDIREFFPAMMALERLNDGRDEAAELPAFKSPALERLGDYRIIRQIGRGGMGIVYEAEQVSLGRRVALKVLPKQLLVDARTKHRFEREARAAARLHHTNIVPVFGVGEHEGLPYYVMQFIQGLGLDEVLRELRRLKPGARSAAPRRGRAAAICAPRPTTLPRLHLARMSPRRRCALIIDRTVRAGGRSRSNRARDRHEWGQRANSDRAGCENPLRTRAGNRNTFRFVRAVVNFGPTAGSRANACFADAAGRGPAARCVTSGRRGSPGGHRRGGRGRPAAARG